MSSSIDNTTSGEPTKASGQYHSVKGTIVETIGDLTGASSWKQSGQEEHAAGEAEHNAAKAKGFAEGTANRVSGKVDNVIGAVTGNEERQAKGKVLEKEGEAQQAIN